MTELLACEVVIGQFAWWTQVCGKVATDTLDDEFGDPQPVCEEHYEEYKDG